MCYNSEFFFSSYTDYNIYIYNAYSQSTQRIGLIYYYYYFYYDDDDNDHYYYWYYYYCYNIIVYLRPTWVMD